MRFVMSPLRRLALVCAVVTLSAGCADTRDLQVYNDYTAKAVEAGDLRTDFAPEDARYSNADLVRNFRRIVFFSEFSDIADRAARPTPGLLNRWAGPIRYRLLGSGVTAHDRGLVKDLADRFAELTGESVTSDPGDANLSILIGDRRERRIYARNLRAQTGDRDYLDVIERNLIDEPCLGLFFNQGPGESVITRAIVVVKAATRGILRDACLHEELAQVLGPRNDYAGARPSVFNDDNEFALLTEHDEHILRILYDPRLRPGMSSVEGMPLVRRIVDEIRPGGGQA